jgi:hypothetical protein
VKVAEQTVGGSTVSQAALALDLAQGRYTLGLSPFGKNIQTIGNTVR